MTRLRLACVALLALVAAYLLVPVRIAAQLPGYPVGIPQSVQSTVYGYLFGGTWTPAGAGAVVAVNASIQPQAGNSANIDGVLIAPTVTYSSSALTTVTTASSLRLSAPVLATSGIATGVTFIVDAAPTNATTNFASWIKGAIAASGTGPVLLSSPTYVPTIKSGGFGTSPSIAAGNGTDVFLINVGTSPGASGVVILPTANVGWACMVQDRTSTGSYSRVTATAVDSVTIANFGFNSSSQLNWTASDILMVQCKAY